MQAPVQLGLFEQRQSPKYQNRDSEWGTFKDSLRAPVHRWFTYPAGFSYKAVEHSIERFGIAPGQAIYDPFMGSGTTNLTAKTLGIHSFGVEAHPFVYRITQAKMNWEVERSCVLEFLKTVRLKLPPLANSIQSTTIEAEFPELILKCYRTNTLADLLALRTLVAECEMSDEVREFFFVAVTALLREVSTAATGWPYIAPNKQKVTSLDKDVLTEFGNLARRMVGDLEEIKVWSNGRYQHTSHTLIHGDSRDTTGQIPDESVDHIFTSPPYLNNFDYADRTRLELYFWGEAKTWGDITRDVRDKLMTSATTQIARSDAKYEISADLQADCPGVAEFVATAVTELASRRLHKGGKKSYDLMVAGYFNDIHQIVRDVYRVLKSNTKALFVLGDSAPYGVHIPTDKLIGEIGLGVGFSDYDIEVLRTRGDKWKENPQRHSVALRESIVILNKR